jgi:Domain of unknown function (DUF1707)/Cell wall-active antibiotics response 4TMS YvqF
MADNGRMDPQGSSDNSRLRASDADRDQAASVLNSAMAEGRLTAEEHSERLDAVYAAKTHADIVPLLDDLPGHGMAVAPVPAPGAPAPTGPVSRILAILSGATRKGAWHVEPTMDIFTVLGGVELDFREAVLPGREVHLKVNCLLGGVEITVPPEMRVVDSGWAILGGREITGDSDESAQPDAPLLRITGTCILGGVDVKRKRRKKDGGGRRPVIRIESS